MDLYLEPGGDDDVRIKIQGEEWELNIILMEEEMYLFDRLHLSVWGSGEMIIAGKSAGANVHWAFDADANVVSLLVGHDYQTWDFGVRIPAKDLLEAVRDYKSK